MSLFPKGHKDPLFRSRMIRTARREPDLEENREVHGPAEEKCPGPGPRNGPSRWLRTGHGASFRAAPKLTRLVKRRMAPATPAGSCRNQE